jgi:hypothetical protein
MSPERNNNDGRPLVFPKRNDAGWEKSMRTQAHLAGRFAALLALAVATPATADENP